MKIDAAVTEAKGAPFAIQELELDDIRPDEVLVKISASGICHTDIIVRDQWYPVPLPAVLGHEGAGVVERVGSAVQKVKPGDRVGLSYGSCGYCPKCQTGRPMNCHDFWARNWASTRSDGSTALSRDGKPIHTHFFGQSSFGTYSVAPERNVTKLPEDAPLDIVAPFGCGIQTGAGSVLNNLRPPAGSNIVIFGTGAVGIAAILGARIAGCTKVIGVDVREGRLKQAMELGCTHVINGAEKDAVEEIKRLTGGIGADYTLETTGVAAVFRQAVDALAPDGTCGLVGAPAFGTEVSLDVNTILAAGRRIQGIIEGDSVPDVFIPRLIDLWREGKFPIEQIMTYYDFDQIDEAAHDAETGKVIKPVLRVG